MKTTKRALSTRESCAKLDSDRKKKGCEYAVLSHAEPENRPLYNEGIVDVSYRYEKMYVIRPQFFIPIISILRNAALSALQYKTELAEVRNHNMDHHELRKLDGRFQNKVCAQLRPC